MTRRRRYDGCCREGVACALACCLLLGIVGCRPRHCVVDPPDRAIDAPVALASELQERLARALDDPTGATIAIREEELTALLRQALQDSPAHDPATHVTEEALYLQAVVGRGRVPVQASLVPAADEGRLVVRVSCLTVDGRPMPRIAGATIEAVVAALAADPARSLRVASVTLREGALVVVAERRPLSGQ